MTVKITGLIPGKSVQPVFGSGQSGEDFGSPIVADADGVVTVVFVIPGAAVGTYNFGVFNAQSVGASVAVTVVADGTSVATPAAPISGKDSFTG